MATERRALVVKEKIDSGYYHVYGVVKTYQEEQSGFYWPDHYTSQGVALGKIYVWSQAEISRPETAPYGREIMVRDVYVLDRHEVRALDRLLDKANKALDKYTEEEGYALSLGQFFVRAAKALGCESAIIPCRFADWSDKKERVCKLGELQLHVDNLVSDFQQGKLDRDRIRQAA